MRHVSAGLADPVRGLCAERVLEMVMESGDVMITLTPKAKWVQFSHPMGGLWYRWGECSAHIAKEAGLWHLSISHPRRYPSWDEIYQAWYDLVPEAQERTGAIILPRKAEYVNIHQNCFHVHELTDAEVSEAKVIIP